RAVGSDEADLVSLEEPERQLFEERPGPVGLAGRVTAQEERAAHRGYFFFFFFGFFFSFRMPMPLATCSPPFHRDDGRRGSAGSKRFGKSNDRTLPGSWPPAISFGIMPGASSARRETRGFEELLTMRGAPHSVESVAPAGIDLVGRVAATPLETAPFDHLYLE